MFAIVYNCIFVNFNTYNTIADYIGAPKAQRAVGTAVGANPIAIIIPCHRVVQKNGETGQYRWGTERKKALLDLELSQAAKTLLSPSLSL